MDTSPKGGTLGLAAVKEIYIENLKNYTKAQLLEMRDRQSKLLANK